MDKEITRIEKFIRKKANDLGREGGLVPLSGGLDSAVTASL